LFYKCVSCVTILSFYTIYFLKFIFTLGALNSLLYCIHYDWNTRWLHDNMYYIGVAPNKKVVRPIFFVGGGHFPYIFFRYMYIHKDKFLCIFSQMKNNAYLPVHLVHAPRFWWSSSYSFTFSFLCVFFQFMYFVRYFCHRFLCFVFVSWLSNLSILSVPDEGYSRNALCALNLMSTFYYYHWVDTTGVGLLVPEGIIRPVVSDWELT
jgi:hypothetical protein